MYCVRVIIKPIKEGYSTACIQICMNCLKTLNLRLYYAHLKMACIDIRTYSFKHRVIYVYVRFTAFEQRFRYQSWNGKNLKGFGNVALVFGKMRYFVMRLSLKLNAFKNVGMDTRINIANQVRLIILFISKWKEDKHID